MPYQGAGELQDLFGARLYVCAQHTSAGAYVHTVPRGKSHVVTKAEKLLCRHLHDARICTAAQRNTEIVTHENPYIIQGYVIMTGYVRIGLFWQKPRENSD